jgi:hypothetical protein
MKRKLLISVFIALFWAIALQPTALASAKLDRSVEVFRSLPGQVSLFIEQDGTPLVEVNAEKALGVASTFKLLVLTQLKREIDAGDRNWQDVIELQPQWKSLPSGILQTWADYSPLTLQTLATLMISLSDNTATDALIYTLGREKLEVISDRNRPFLTTRQAFILKNPDNQILLQKYLNADLKTREKMLPAIERALLPDVDFFNQGIPLAPEIEWFFSTKDLCKLMQQITDLPLMQINPGIVNNPQKWQTVSFKGGSEPGIVNYTSWLNSSSTCYCVAATWNHSRAIDEDRFYALYNELVESLQ